MREGDDREKGRKGEKDIRREGDQERRRGRTREGEKKRDTGRGGGGALGRGEMH